MKTTPTLDIIQSALRLLPPGTRGKARLARLLLGHNKRRDPALLRDREGNLLWVPNRLEPVGMSLWMDGVYEHDVMAFLRQYFTNGSTFLDVGANVGAFSVPLASAQKGSSGRVIAIEASPSIVEVLENNVALNHLTNVHVIHCAASSGKAESIDFYEAPLESFGMGSSAPQFGVAPRSIPARSVDDILTSLSCNNVSVMKVDVEGFEAEVFEGAKGFLTSAQSPRIVFEFCDWAEERAFPGKCGLAQEVLLRLGYRLWRLADFISKQAPLRSPLTTGFESIVASK